MIPAGKKGILRRSLAEFVFVKGRNVEEDAVRIPFPKEVSAKHFLRRFLRNRSCLASLRNRLLGWGLAGNLSRLDDQGVLRACARHLVSGRIRVFRVGLEDLPARSVISVGTEEEVAEERPRRRPAVFPESPEPRNWVKLLIVEDESNEPIPGVGLKLKLPSGKIVESKTDWFGTIYLDDLDPGIVDILEMLDDEALEVVGME